MAIPEKTYGEQGPGYQWDEHKCKYHLNISKYASLHIHRRHTGSKMRKHLSAKTKIIYNTGLVRKDNLEHSIRHYWPIRSKLAMVEGLTVKGKGKIIHFQLQKLILQQLHSNNMGIEKKKPLGHELLYWVNMNADINSTVIQNATCMEYQQTQPHEKAIPYEMP